MAFVRDVLTVKGIQVHCTTPDATAQQAILHMLDRNVGSLLVQEGSAIVGIITERDYLRRVLLRQADPRTTRVREVMTPDPVSVDPGWSVDECMTLMTDRRIRHLPVIENGLATGMISIGDLVKHVSDERAAEIRHLTEYIMGRA